MTQEQVAVTAEKIRAGKTSLGIEFGSTRIKAVLIDDAYHTIAAGDYEWASHLEDGLWSYTQEEIWKGLQTAYARMAGDVETAYGERLTHVGHIGFSAMMHGYLAFDKSGELLVPFRTWQNTNTHEAHEKLSELFQYNIPERWSVAHLYQAVLNHEEHVSKVDYITTLAGYVHWKLTGEKVLGVGDASGMFLGGILRHSSLSVVGKYAENILADFSCSKLFIGVDGIDLDFGITTTNMMEASLNRVMMQTAQKTIVLADSSKFGRRGFSKIADMEDIDHIITDSKIPPSTALRIEEMGIELTIADPCHHNNL